MLGEEWPPNNDAILKSIHELFDSGAWWIYKGEVVREFEERFARSHGCRHGVSVCNGMVALDIILRALGIGAGDRVMLPAYNYYSLPKSVLNVGAEPVFVDICADNLTMDPALAAELMVKYRPAALVVAHISGCTADLNTLQALCEEHGALLIEDCAQAHAASVGGKRVGGWGCAGLFSFGGVKLMTCGQGGMIVTDDPVLYEKAYAIANRGLAPGGSRNQFGIIGDNYQLSELSAAVLGPQLDLLDELFACREARMSWLDDKLGTAPHVKITRQFPATTGRAQMSYGFYIDFRAAGYQSKKELIDRAAGDGIALRGGYQSISRDEHYGRDQRGGEVFPEAERAHETEVGFHHPLLLRDDRYWDEALSRLSTVLGG